MSTTGTRRVGMAWARSMGFAARHAAGLAAREAPTNSSQSTSVGRSPEGAGYADGLPPGVARTLQHMAATVVGTTSPG